MMTRVGLAIEISSIAVGLTCLIYSLINAHKFWKLKRTLSRAFAANLCGEAIATALTLGFAICQLMGVMPSIPDIVQGLLRICLFGGMLVPSVNLKHAVRQIETNQ